MRRRLTAGFLVGVLSLFGLACDDTVDGVQEDVEEGVDDLDDQVGD